MTQPQQKTTPASVAVRIGQPNYTKQAQLIALASDKGGVVWGQGGTAQTLILDVKFKDEATATDFIGAAKGEGFTCFLEYRGQERLISFAEILGLEEPDDDEDLEESPLSE